MMNKIITYLKPCYKILEPYLTLWSLLVGVGVLGLVWGGVKLIFRYLFYPNSKLRQDVEIIPRELCFNSDFNLSIYLFLINLSPYLRIAVKQLSGWINNNEIQFSGNFKLFSCFYKNSVLEGKIVKRNSIAIVELKIPVNESQKQILTNRSDHRLNLNIEISSGKRNIEKGFTIDTIFLRR